MNTTFFPEQLIHSRNAESIDEHFSNITHSDTSLSEFEMRQIKLTELKPVETRRLFLKFRY